MIGKHLEVEIFYHPFVQGSVILQAAPLINIELAAICRKNKIKQGKVSW